MEKTPFAVMVRYREVTQPQQYHSQEAEVSAQFTIGDDKIDPQGVIEDALSKVKRQVRIALNLEIGAVTAVANDPAKRGPGRPRKTEPTETAVADAAARQEGKNVDNSERRETASEAPKEDTKPAPAEDDFGDTTEPEKPKEITDAEVQEACRKAVNEGKGAIVAADVKNLARLKYGTDKVVAIKQNERQKFLDDLKNLVAEKTKK